MNKDRVAPTELPQLLLQNRNTCKIVIFEATAQSCCQNLYSCKVNFKNTLLEVEGARAPVPHSCWSWTFSQPVSMQITFSPQNCPFAWGSGPHLIHGSLGPPESKPQMTSRSVQPFLYSSRLWQNDRQTDRQTRVALRRSRLPPRWWPLTGIPFWYATSHPGQLSLVTAWPSSVGRHSE